MGIEKGQAGSGLLPPQMSIANGIPATIIRLRWTNKSKSGAPSSPTTGIIEQLAKCSQEYGCFTAQNIMYRRWEGGIPVSPACNAQCLACLSYQPEGAVDSPQQRICFTPQCREITEIALAHLQQAEDAIISFGQGCEGEPSLSYPVICEALEEIRRQTDKGILNINTNAGHSAAIRALIDHGMDSLRVSMFSPLAADYEAYHQPKDYCFADVCASLAYAQEKGVPVALESAGLAGLYQMTHSRWRH